MKELAFKMISQSSCRPEPVFTAYVFIKKVFIECFSIPVMYQETMPFTSSRIALLSGHI